MRVTLQTALGVTVGLLVAGKVPDDQVLVATTGEQHVGAAEKKKNCQKQPCKPKHPRNHVKKEKNSSNSFHSRFLPPTNRNSEFLTSPKR